VYYTIQSGYDTHAAQLGTHANLLREFAGALKAFLEDLAGARLADRVTLLAFSEFGRQLQENASAGTFWPGIKSRPASLARHRASPTWTAARRK
jgi:uncharacterized protein (DUF1501 family)